MYLTIRLIGVFFLMLGNAYGQYCTNDNRFSETQYFDTTEITTGVNVQYGVAMDYQGNPTNLLMDFYYPNLAIDTSPKRPFILLFHGGGFTSGDKQSGDIRDLCIHLAMRGFVCASVNYRLGDAFTEYGQYKARYRAIQDGNAALRYVVNNANTIRIDTNWLFVGGQSAGSLLALGMVYADQNELDSISLLYNSTAASLELGNLNTSGNNLTNQYSIKGIFNNWGAITKSEMDKSEMIPTIAFHGELDTTVYINSDNTFLHYTLNGSRAIHTGLINNNICSELTVDLNGEHGIYRNASSVFRAQRASCFFKSIFCNNCSNFYSTDSIATNCSSSLDLNESTFETQIKVFPNPFEDHFTLEGMNEGFDITIYNAFGKVVFKNENSTENSFEIKPDLLPGVYVLVLNQLKFNRSKVFKLIKN
jgi:predicted esterase